MKFSRTLLALAFSLVAGAAAAQYPKDDHPPHEIVDIGVTKKGPGPVIDGQNATFTLTPYNVGPSTVGAPSGIQVVDTLPIGFTGPVTWSGAGWSCIVSVPTVTCTYSGPNVVAGGAFTAITITARAGGKGPYLNCAVVGIRRGPDVNKTNDKSCVEGPVNPPKGGGDKYDVRIRKIGPMVVQAGQQATFVLSPYNVGPSTVNSSTGVTVSDTLPGAFSPPVTFTAPGWSCIPSGLVVNCLYIGLPVGPNAPLPTITLTATAKETGGYVNCAEIGLKRAKDVNPEGNKSCFEGKIEKEGKRGYDVGITKRPGGPMSVGQQATFILSPYNTGPSSVNGSTGVVVVDILPAIFGQVVSASGTGWNCSTSGSGPYTVTCAYVGPASVGANSPMPPITVSAMPMKPGEYLNCAEIGLKANDDLNPRDNEGCVKGKVDEKKPDGKPDISLTKTARDMPWTWPNGTGSYELKITNTGGVTIPAGYTFQITDHLPAGMSLTSVSAAWSCIPTPPVTGPVSVVCSYVSTAPLAPNAWIAMTAQVALVGEKQKQYENCAEARVVNKKALWPEVDLRNNRDCEMTEVKGGGGGSPFDIGINKEGPDVVLVGQTATWTLTPFNAASVSLSFYQPNPGPFIPNNPTTVTVTDTLPPGFTLVSVSGTDWNCIPAGNGFTCTYTGTAVFGPGQPLPTITVQAVADRPGETENCAHADIGGAFFIQDLNQANNKDCVPTVIKPDGKKQDVAVDKTALDGPWSWPNGTGYYQFKISNPGGAPVPAGYTLQIVEHIPAGMTLLSTPGAWPCTPTPPVAGSANVTCSHVLTAPLNGGAFITFNMQMGFNGPKQPSYENCVDLRVVKNKALWADVNLENNHDCAPVEVKGDGRRYDVLVEKKGPTGPLNIGDTATFTLYPGNFGPSPVTAANGVTVSDTLPSNFAPPATVTAPDWDCEVIGLQVTCTYIGTATFGAGYGLPPITISAVAETAGQDKNCAKIDLTNGPDVKLSDNESCVPVVIRPGDGKKDDVAIEKTALDGPWSWPNGTGYYQFKISNLGGAPIPAGYTLQIVEHVPPGMTLLSAPGAWPCTPTLPVSGSANVTCSHVLTAPLNGGAFITFNMQMGFNGPKQPSYENCVDLRVLRQKARWPETSLENNHDCAPVEVKGDAGRYDVMIEKKGPTDPLNIGDTAIFTLYPGNFGPTPVTAANGVTVTDTLLGNFASPVTVTAPDWNCIVNGLSVSCTYIGTATFGAGYGLPPITISAVTETAGQIQNCAKIDLTNGPDIKLSDNESCVPVVIRPPVAAVYDLRLDKEPWISGWSYGSVGAFNITVTNDGPPIAAGSLLTLTDTLPPGMTLSSIAGPWYCLPGAPLTGPATIVCKYQPATTLATGDMVLLQAWVGFTGPQLPSYQNCAGVVLHSAAPGFPLLPEATPDNNNDCASVTLPPPAAPQFEIEKVVEQDCTGTPPSTLCKFVIRVFNPTGTPYTGPLTFTDTVTSFGNLTGGVSLASPLPAGWTCTGAQPVTCTISSVTIGANGGYVAVPLYMTINGAVPPTQNCAEVAEPTTAGPACVPMGSTHYDLGLDSNFLAPVTMAGSPPMAELDYVISASPALPVGSQVIVNGSLTGGTTFAPWLIVGTPWSCSGTWASFLCTHTVTSTSFSSGFLWLKMKTTYPGLDIGHPFTYVGSVTMNNNVDLIGSNNSRTAGGFLP